ncbi:unnamed protein product [Didymodactylos carnosus]|uniref:Uncharacterized protein n=1 Tax=Didymodactylos carnosus TaxID=1234261 RepID=A0A814LEC5_9BILA|nr:unnamed protein product [Didymodactylos carnosus]CAF1064599.1 unnamed protein product [Didymodactylos carnosus]CAF3752330.1 unnamed protein product [Didymodactylos carnosus]CAF3832463.1 unnamed protein product [Didymodactylos carnosus]
MTKNGFYIISLIILLIHPLVNFSARYFTSQSKMNSLAKFFIYLITFLGLTSFEQRIDRFRNHTRMINSSTIYYGLKMIYSMAASIAIYDEVAKQQNFPTKQRQQSHRKNNNWKQIRSASSNSFNTKLTTSKQKDNFSIQSDTRSSPNTKFFHFSSKENLADSSNLDGTNKINSSISKRGCVQDIDLVKRINHRGAGSTKSYPFDSKEVSSLSNPRTISTVSVMGDRESPLTTVSDVISKSTRSTTGSATVFDTSQISTTTLPSSREATLNGLHSRKSLSDSATVSKQNVLLPYKEKSSAMVSAREKSNAAFSQRGRTSPIFSFHEVTSSNVARDNSELLASNKKQSISEESEIGNSVVDNGVIPNQTQTSHLHQQDGKAQLHPSPKDNSPLSQLVHTDNTLQKQMVIHQNVPASRNATKCSCWKFTEINSKPYLYCLVLCKKTDLYRKSTNDKKTDKIQQQKRALPLSSKTTEK